MRVNLGHKARYHFSETGEIDRDEMLISQLGGIPVSAAAPIGCINLEMARLIGANTDLVKIGQITISKLASKHTMVLHYDLGHAYPVSTHDHYS